MNCTNDCWIVADCKQGSYMACYYADSITSFLIHLVLSIQIGFINDNIVYILLVLVDIIFNLNHFLRYVML